MDFSKHVEYFSTDRMNKYLQSTTIPDSEKEILAIKIYAGNIKLSKSFHPLISVLEVALRNGINKNLCQHFQSQNWLLEQKKGFMIDSSLTYRDYQLRKEVPDNFFREKVEEAERKLNNKNVRVTHSRLLAELSFGFWTKFFDSKPVKLLNGQQLNAFKSGTMLKASDVYAILNEIRLFRNRISHHEPICFNSRGEFCLKNATTTYFKIKESLRWLGKDIRDWSENFDTFQTDITPLLS